MSGELRHPVRPINQEVYYRLSLEDNQVRPLPGGTGKRPAGLDPRLSQAHLMIGADTKVDPGSKDLVTFYEHIATVRYRDPQDAKNDRFFVAFRQTMDALMLEQADPVQYPEWLMKDPVKRTELRVYIYMVYRLPRQVPNLTSLEDWLTHISDPLLFDTIAHFLLKSGVISEEMYGSMK